MYTDDIPALPGTLYTGLVLSARPHARLIQVDPSAAEAAEGVERFLSVKDVPEGGTNVIGEHTDRSI
ncbi:unnamed protein product, partial [Discosporangium mesarthrocarpum]